MLEIPLYTSNEQFIEKRNYYNTPLEKLIPNLDIILVEEHPNFPVDLSQDFIGYNLTYASGSSAKAGGDTPSVFIGLKRDIGVETGMFTKAEDVIRFQRWLLAQGWFGIAEGEFNVITVKDGGSYNGHLIGDGYGLISRSLANRLYNDRPKIALNDARGSYSFYQRIPWSEIKDEATPLIIDKLNQMTDPGEWLNMLSSYGFDYKAELTNIEPIMYEHPYVALSIARARGEYLYRTATTVPYGGKTKVAVPSREFCTVANQSVIARYPIDSYSSIQAVNECDNLEEIERVNNLEIIQYSLSSLNLSAKGCLAIVDDLDVDIVLCNKDVKLGEIGGNCVLTANMWFDKNTAIGVASEWSKDLLGLDYDGDMLQVIDTTNYPCLHHAVINLPKYTNSSKLSKTKSPLNQRGEIINKMRKNLVGFASKMTAKTFYKADRNFTAFSLGYQNEQTLESFCHFSIKAGTDLFKTNINTIDIERPLSVLQSKMLMLDIDAPWTNWPQTDYFKQKIPMSIEKVIDYPLVQVNGETITISDDDYKYAILPEMNGTIAEICKITLPYIGKILEHPIQVRPLNYFTNWAQPVSASIYDIVKKEIQFKYISYAVRLNWKNPSEINEMRLTLNKDIDRLSDEYGRMNVANALWRVGHNAKGSNNQSASVFILMPDEAKFIVENKSTHKAKSIILTGLKYQFDDLDNFGNADISIQEINIEKNGRKIIRMVACGQIDGQKKPKDDNLPNNLIGFIAKNGGSLPIGNYSGKIERVSEGAWKFSLS